MGSAGRLKALAAIVPIRAGLALMADTIDGLVAISVGQRTADATDFIAAIAKGMVSRVTARCADLGKIICESGRSNDWCKVMAWVVALLIFHARNAEIVIRAILTCEHDIFGKYLKLSATNDQRCLGAAYL